MKAIDLRMKMDEIYCECDRLIPLFKNTKQYFKIKWIKNYCVELLKSQQIEFWGWFIDSVLHEPIDSAFENLKTVRI